MESFFFRMGLFVGTYSSKDGDVKGFCVFLNEKVLKCIYIGL